ncbi:PREDICTED: putative tRNA pseudouridine synthase Pus10 [Nicrophorus vespilloides]|uniref:tRNA pseudouridine(55) synthase n=1 Tax=Nicrophorus vespilloides TaxID=110193 RepID=A0ABM1MLC3_NICVS|nr:PREDICTED: putative tRNA pseudouridine synthase Pus10 [Nicrophorus vespilloides]
MTSEEKTIFKYLRDLGVCLNCSLRYLCDKKVDFADVDVVVKQKQLSEAEIEDVPIKKVKGNPCLVCLGLLQETHIDDVLNHPDLGKVSGYDSKVFTIAISMPAAILLREHSMRLHLEDKFPMFFNEENQEIPINRAWKMFVSPKLAEKIQKEFQNSDICEFSINVSTGYDEETEELLVLKEMQPKIFEMRTLQHRKYSGELFSRKGVLSALSVTPSGIFKMHGQVPPDVPSKQLVCKEIECKHKPIYMAGRYCKYSRDLSQSPWVIDGVKAMETSVQEIMFEQFCKVFQIPEENMKFSSSGREDCDVRCLGKGRPFYVELSDPKRTEYTPEEYRQVEKGVEESKLIKISDLQKVQRAELTNIKDGEESKTKSYVALCVTKTTVTDELLEKINSHGGLEVSQKTPIRVLHRRPLATRTRRIESMQAFAIEGHSNCFELHVVTQAGTYVKEFVHGDFDRTTPNLRRIIGAPVDIAALDVTAINLDWPKPVNYDT